MQWIWFNGNYPTKHIQSYPVKQTIHFLRISFYLIFLIFFPFCEHTENWEVKKRGKKKYLNDNSETRGKEDVYVFHCKGCHSNSLEKEIHSTNSMKRQVFKDTFFGILSCKFSFNFLQPIENIRVQFYDSQIFCDRVK